MLRPAVHADARHDRGKQRAYRQRSAAPVERQDVVCSTSLMILPDRHPLGAKVYQGDMSVGQIEDVLVALNHGATTAVILSVGGFLRVGDKLVAVPVAAIRVGTEAKFTTDLTKDQLGKAPTFDFGRGSSAQEPAH